ncbi:conjugative transposon protein TraM [Pedobacter sp. ISL-68]|uniref:conjugative transposon protein TraM n=1 Tax=unclassified Pedobacter TaxID=2628915 RepID=UPI001BE8D239|nr:MULTISPECIES: conjugative transposon protein TraM [unclassified Pedobacter]MBT2561290.1 conjugative transposon protein TraM [Pedobacter sp. ISL-64]MBT2590680.1 conjugative transposon protein TraM [Pedobacter sp. ISL-68]
MRRKTNYTKKQKFLLILPVLVVPFLTMGFYALGGGQSKPATEVIGKGLNQELPDAHIENKEMDKMAYYDKASSDSMQNRKENVNDPYAQNPQLTGGQLSSTGLQGFSNAYPDGSNPNYGADNEARIYQKLGALNKALNQPINDNTQDGQHYNSTNGKRAIDPGDIDRLEQMMHSMQDNGGVDDPETKQLNNMLEKILDIQHPERVREKIKQSEDSRKGQVYSVLTGVKKDRISFLENSDGLAGSGFPGIGFYGVESSLSDEDAQNAIEAVVHENQTLVNGSTVKLRLLDTIHVKGTLVPKDNFVYGTVSLDGERLIIKITSLRYKKSLFPVQLSVFDIDGMDGIYIPGAIARDVAKQSTEQTIQGIGLNTFDQSLGAQAAGAGIEAAKTLFSKKIKLIKVMVKAGYKVLLRDDKQKDE